MRGLTTHELPYQADSAALFALVRDLPDAIWLDSGKPLSSQGRYDLISASPDSVIETRGDLSTISDSLGVRESAAVRLNWLNNCWTRCSTAPLALALSPIAWLVAITPLWAVLSAILAMILGVDAFRLLPARRR
jgi:hypothetical protein